MMEDTEMQTPVRKSNRRRAEEADRTRPIVTGALPYRGHRPDPKHEQRRLAELERKARSRS